MVIGVVDSGFGTAVNLVSMLDYIGFRSALVSDARELKKYSHAILPGVGSFSTGSAKLAKTGFRSALLEFASADKPLLGVCLGMQLLGLSSDEGAGEGLGLFDFRTVKLSREAHSKAHMGWNSVKWTSTVLDQRFEGTSRFYFNHSFGVASSQPCGVGLTYFESNFTSVVMQNRILGAQFHPEKSHHNGMALMTYFAKEI